MTITSALGFDPIWSSFNLTGVSAGGAKLYSYDSLNPTTLKPIYSDAGLNFPYPNPILFNENGNAPGQFYFSMDSTNPSSLYDLYLYDTNDNLIWNVNNYFPSGGSGGSVTTAINLNNLIINNVFWRNIGSMEQVPAAIPITTMVTSIAPGAHDGLSTNVTPTPITLTANSFGPDIYLIRSNNSATESVKFTPFTLGSNALSPDNTPLQYINHKVTGTGTSETYRYYQIPVNGKVQSLSNQTVTFTIWAQLISGSAQLNLQWAQFFGDGPSASTTAITTFATPTLNNSWTKYSFTVVAPNVSAKTLGECGNDGLFILIGLPLTAAFEINFTKPSLYVGSSAPRTDFINYDEIDSQINNPRTGDTKIGLNNFSFGYLPMNDGSIGSFMSSATTKKGVDTFPLFNLLWNSIDNAYAPVLPSRGASAVADFVANKTIALTKSLGRVFAGTLVPQVSQTATFDTIPTTSITVGSSAGFFQAVPVIFTTTGTLPGGLQLAQGSTTNSIVYYAETIDATHIRVFTSALLGSLITITSSGSGTISVKVAPYKLGQYVGEELHSLNISEIPAHTHNTFSQGIGGSSENAPTGGRNTPNDAGTSGSTGGGLGHNTLQPTTYMNIFIKL